MHPITKSTKMNRMDGDRLAIQSCSSVPLDVLRGLRVEGVGRVLPPLAINTTKIINNKANGIVEV